MNRNIIKYEIYSKALPVLLVCDLEGSKTLIDVFKYEM